MHLPPVADSQHTLAHDGYVCVPHFWTDAVSDGAAALASRVIDRSGVHIQRTSGDDVLDYHVVTGDVIQTEASALFDLFTSDRLVAWLRSVTGATRLAPSRRRRSAININCLSRTGQGYPFHTDAVPYTVVLFLTTLPPSAGGEFLILSVQGELVTIPPSQGMLLLMDGSMCAHSVAPLRQDVRRLSVPMVYPAVADERPEGLDDYLYEPGR